MKYLTIPCSFCASLALLLCLITPALADPVQAELDAYAKNAIDAMTAKERDSAPIVRKSKDREGYIASYTRVKPDTTVRARYSKAPRSMPGILYLGEIRYTRLRYDGVKPTLRAEDALSGPFSVREEVTVDLVQYKDGQWMPR